jgi:acyl-CoA reductase-like NAD-dependent aldehyde dehydrogenase
MTGQAFGHCKQGCFGRKLAHEGHEHYTYTKSVITNKNEGSMGIFR